MSIRMVLAVSLLSALAACATSGVETTFGDATDFSQYRTWNWLPGGGEGVTGLAPDMDRRVRSAIGRALKDRGLEVAGEQPDFLVSYAIDSGALGSPRAGGYHHGVWGWRRTVQTGGAVSESTMTLVFTDADTKQPVWKGSAGGVIADPKSEDTNVTKTIHVILAEYPPAP